MSIIDRVARRYDEITRDPVAVVPEWPDEQGKPTVVYADPWTVRDHERFQKLHGEDADWAIHVVIAKAKDAAGARLFDDVDLTKILPKAERHVLLRIAHCIMFSMTLDDAKKNSPTTQEPDQ